MLGWVSNCEWNRAEVANWSIFFIKHVGVGTTKSMRRRWKSFLRPVLVHDDDGGLDIGFSKRKIFDSDTINHICSHYFFLCII